VLCFATVEQATYAALGNPSVVTVTVVVAVVGALDSFVADCWLQRLLSLSLDFVPGGRAQDSLFVSLSNSPIAAHWQCGATCSCPACMSAIELCGWSRFDSLLSGFVDLCSLQSCMHDCNSTA
jgi:hypothetical protein